MMPMSPQPAGLPSGSFGGRGRSPMRAGAARGVAGRAPLLTGSLLLAATALWWAVALVAQAMGLPLPWTVQPALAQALAGVLGLLPLLALGVLFGAGPRVLGLGAVPARLLSLPVTLMSIGWALALPGFHASRAVSALGLATAAVGLALAVGLFGLLVLEAPRPLRRAGAAVLAGCGLTVAGLWAAAVMVALSRDANAALLAALAGAGGLCATLAVAWLAGLRGKC